MTDTGEATRIERGSWIVWIPGLALLTGLVWLVVTHQSEERQFALLLTRARPRWLVVAALLQAATYLSVGETWRLPLAAAGYRFSRWRLARLALIKLTLDQAVPTGGLSGAVFMSRYLRQLGVSGEVLGATMLIVVAGYYLAYAVAVLAALAVLWIYHDLNVVVAAVAITFAALATVLPLFLLWRVRRRQGKPPRWLQRLPWFRKIAAETALASPQLVSRRSLFAGCAAGSFATMLLDSLTLVATLLAVGARPSFPTSFAALVMASVAATVGFMPGGLGTFEAGSVAVLTLTGTDGASALSATLLLRGFTFWLPMIPGVLFLRRPRAAGAAARRQHLAEPTALERPSPSHDQRDDELGGEH
jgi:uncharacterized membrane protein YbhN (UPF0104 family)